MRNLRSSLLMILTDAAPQAKRITVGLDFIAEDAREFGAVLVGKVRVHIGLECVHIGLEY